MRCKNAANAKRGKQPFLEGRLPCSFLLADAELRDERTVTLDVGLLQVRKQVASVTDHHQKPAAGMVVLFVGLQVLGQIVNPLREHRNLDLRRAGVALMGGVFGHNGLLFFLGHVFHLFQNLPVAQHRRRLGEYPAFAYRVCAKIRACRISVAIIYRLSPLVKENLAVIIDVSVGVTMMCDK